MGRVLVDVAGWVFLAGVLIVVVSALPRVAQRRGRWMGLGFLLAAGSLGMVLLGWWLQQA